jgi:transporter family-2 protein
MTAWVFVAMALMAGAALSLQVAINAVLAKGTGHAVWAAAISFFVGLTALLLIGTLSRARLPSLSVAGGLPWWAWVGGLLGAIYVVSTIVVIPKLGAATLIALVVAGQMLTSLVLDHFGAFGLQEQGVTVWRAAGAVLLVAGVVLIRMV